MRKYRIKKYVDGHGKPIYYAQEKVGKLFWCYLKVYEYEWSEPKQFDTIKEANDHIAKEIDSSKKYQRNYKETFQCFIVPKHVPKEQIEKFLKEKEDA